MRHIALLFAMLLTACPPHKQPSPPPPDAGGFAATGGTSATGGTVATGGTISTGGVTGWQTTLSKCVLACLNLEELQCPVERTTCINQCDLHSRDGRFTQNVDCLIAAKTQADAQKCGPAACR